MNIANLLLIITLAITSANSAMADSSEAPCDVDLSLTSEEANSYGKFDETLRNKLTGFYGREMFQQKLNEALDQTWHNVRIIDVSPTFMEKLLNLVEQHKLIHYIQMTIGIGNPLWQKFNLAMNNITHHERVITKPLFQIYRANTLKLVEAIQSSKSWKGPLVKLSAYDKGVILARTSMAVSNMNLFIERWNLLNYEIAKIRRQALLKRIMMTSLSITAGAIVISTTIFATPIIAASGAFAAAFVSDVIVAAQFARMGQIAGQVMGGVAIGAVGAPAGKLLLDSTEVLSDAKNASRNNNTNYACELDKQINEWKNKGASPYLSMALLGGGIGAVGGAFTLTQTGAKIILGATGVSVAVAGAFTLKDLGKNVYMSLYEYNLANIEFDKGNEQQALVHLYNSREYAAQAKEKGLEVIILAVLTHALVEGGKSAWINGQEEIRVLFASSTDTLPQAAKILIETGKSFAR